MVQMALSTKLSRARSYWKTLLAAEGALWTAAALLGVFLLCFHADRWLVLPVETRVRVWLGMGVLLVALLAALVLRPLLKPRSEEELAILVERRYPQLRERLLSAVEFSRAPAEQLRGVSTTLLDDLRQEAERETASLRFERAFRPLGVMRSGVGLGGMLLLLALHLVFAGPAFAAFLSRMALNNTPVWRDTRVQVDPLRTKVLKGSDLQVGIHQEGRSMDRARLHFRIGETGRWNGADLKVGKDQNFTHRFASLTETMTYYATAGDGISDKGIVEVVDPPAIVGAKLKLEYPAYMERKPVSLTAESGGIAAPVGTRVTLDLKANKPLDEALMVLGKAAPAAWTVNGEQVAGAIIVKGNGQYTLRLKDTDGFTAPDPQSFPIKAIPDQAPEVQLLDPTGDLEVVPDARVPLAIRATDDYGVANVRAPYQVEGRKPVTLPAGTGGRQKKELALDNEWNLGALNLKPGDTVRYHIEATDFDDLNGPHVGKTSEYQIRIIDRGEAERQYAEQQAEILQQLGDLIKEQKGTRAEVEAQRNAARPNAEAIAGAEDRQRAAATSASDLGRRVAELNRKAQINNLAAKSDLEAQQAARAGLDKLSREAMPDAANKIGGAQPQAQSNPQGAKSELGQASQQQQQILQELNRIAGQMRPANEMERMAERFNRLAQEQRAILGQTDKLLPETLGKSMNELTPQQRAQLSQLSQRQASLQRATAQAQQDLEKAGQSMQSRSPEQADAAQQAAQNLRQSGVTEQQSQAAQNTQQNSLGQARGQQENSAQELEKAAQQLRAAQNASDPKALQRQLNRAMEQLGRMLQRQQEAVQQAQGAMTPEQQRQLSQMQREMQQQAQEMARRLQQLQRRSPNAGKASQAMQQSSKSLGQSSQSLSQGEQQDAQKQAQQAQRQMQRAMQSLQQAMAEAQQEEDPFAELRKNLQQLAAQQKAINQATQQVDAEQQAGNGRPEDAETLRRLAARQDQVETATAKLDPEFPGEAFKSFAQTARRAMRRAEEGLAQGNPKADPTGRAQQRALRTLEQLAKALDNDSSGDSEKDPQQGQQGQSGQSGQNGKPDPELKKRIAELRLLRSMEQAIRSQTQEVDDARNDRMPPTDAQKAEIEETARQQASAKAMADRLSEALKRYRGLAGKISQAGKHMSEAQRGLEKEETGDGVLEQEQQAVVRLSEALKQAQQQQQQQQQQQSKGQQKGQQQGQQGQQPGQQPGQPSGGQAQQGSSPAMRSMSRRSSGEGGPLGEAGAASRGFSGLDPRSQDALRQSYKEKVPPEYHELIGRYFRALSNKGR